MDWSSSIALSDINKMAENEGFGIEGQDEGIERVKLRQKKSNGESGVGKEERWRKNGREIKREREMRSIFLHPVNLYKLTMYIFDTLGYTYCSTKNSANA